MEFHNLDRVELIKSSLNIYKHILYLTISSVLKQRIFILCFVHFFPLSFVYSLSSVDWNQEEIMY